MNSSEYLEGVFYLFLALLFFLIGLILSFSGSKR